VPKPLSQYNILANKNRFVELIFANVIFSQNSYQSSEPTPNNKENNCENEKCASLILMLFINLFFS